MNRVFTTLVWLTFLGVGSGLTGCNSTAEVDQHSEQLGNLLLAEPNQISAREQLKLIRLNHILAQMDDLPAAQRAELLFLRGEVYDGFGLWGLARNDFNLALEYKPDLPEAYNFLGIHYTQEQNFMQAYDAFDSSLEIDPAHSFAFLNRGIALYYGGRQELAVTDFERFLAMQEDDPYRILWLFLAEQELDLQAAKRRLARNKDKVSSSSWARHLIQFYLGEIRERDLLQLLMIDVTNQRTLTERLCEAYFYLGKYHSFQGRKGTASNYFRLALSTNVYKFVEHRFARLELELMRDITFENY